MTDQIGLVPDRFRYDSFIVSEPCEIIHEKIKAANLILRVVMTRLIQTWASSAFNIIVDYVSIVLSKINRESRYVFFTFIRSSTLQIMSATSVCEGPTRGGNFGFLRKLVPI
ncbi:hypothetical protein J6590_010253 [Homalodisca vitripennis]|nr:hypothetical protein J6590_010253 [Homalodisca vitripennis]